MTSVALTADRYPHVLQVQEPELTQSFLEECGVAVLVDGGLSDDDELLGVRFPYKADQRYTFDIQTGGRPSVSIRRMIGFNGGFIIGCEVTGGSVHSASRLIGRCFRPDSIGNRIQEDFVPVLRGTMMWFVMQNDETVIPLGQMIQAQMEDRLLAYEVVDVCGNSVVLEDLYRPEHVHIISIADRAIMNHHVFQKQGRAVQRVLVLGGNFVGMHEDSSLRFFRTDAHSEEVFTDESGVLSILPVWKGSFLVAQQEHGSVRLYVGRDFLGTTQKENLNMPSGFYRPELVAYFKGWQSPYAVLREGKEYGIIPLPKK